MSNIESIKLVYHTGYVSYEDAFTETLYFSKERIYCKRNYLDKSRNIKWEIKMLRDLDKMKIDDSLSRIKECTHLLDLDYYVCDADTTDVIIKNLDLEGNKTTYKVSISLSFHDKYVGIIKGELNKYIPDGAFLPSWLQPYEDDDNADDEDES